MVRYSVLAHGKSMYGGNRGSICEIQRQRRPGSWQLTDLEPAPEEEWQRLRVFMALGDDDLYARHGGAALPPRYELVGRHLRLPCSTSRRRFIWAGRKGPIPHILPSAGKPPSSAGAALGMDFSDDLARHFAAGRSTRPRPAPQPRAPDLRERPVSYPRHLRPFPD
ncbi:MAG: hypothetical protein R3A10_11810 [Caldilineaceae bacterium]